VREDAMGEEGEGELISPGALSPPPSPSPCPGLGPTPTDDKWDTVVEAVTRFAFASLVSSVMVEGKEGSHSDKWGKSQKCCVHSCGSGGGRNISTEELMIGGWVCPSVLKEEGGEEEEEWKQKEENSIRDLDLFDHQTNLDFILQALDSVVPPNEEGGEDVSTRRVRVSKQIINSLLSPAVIRDAVERMVHRGI
jgi:hypothetical protein